MYHINLSEYEDKRTIKTLNIDKLDISNLSNTFKELECTGNIVVKLEANVKLIEEINLLFSNIINDNHIWTAELIINNELGTNEIFLISDK